MKSFFKILLATILALVIVSAFGTIFLISALGGMFASEQVVETKDSSILEIKLEEPIYDRASTNPVDNVDWQSFKVKKALGLNTLLEAIHRAKNDEKIKGIYLNTGLNNTMGFATAQELRHALSKFKASGKFIYAYSNFYTQNAYYLASVADSVFLQPEGAVDFKGLNIKMMFYKNLLSKLGVEMQVIRHGRFKSAVEPFIRTDMSSENKEQYRVLVSSMWGSIIEEIAQSRKVSVAQLNLSADSLAGMLAQDALSHQLVDVVAPYKVFQTSLMKRMKVKEEDKLNLISIQKYMQTEKEIKKTNNKIAVIYAQGEIGMDKGSSYSIGTENIKDAIKAAAADKNVKAIVLRVNSPGGSVLTSDIIYQEVILAQKKKPVVASFGNYAASGGYYISCAANKIYSEPTTLTGSIGVFGIIPNAKKLLNDKLGINFDEVSTNTNSGALYGVDRPLNKMELSLMQRNIENVYASFTSKVAKGRKMSVAEVDSIGQGRVWSGKDAIAIGLVDELGGLDAAISGAAKLAKLKAYKVEEFPKEPNPYTELISSLTTARVKVLNEDLTSTFGPELASWFMQIRALKFLDRPSVMARMDVIVIE